MKVLIVDDEYVIRIGLRSMISWEEHGFTIVAEANNGQVALELIQKYQPEIVITDMKMPVMNGLEFMQKAYELEERPCFLVLSNFDDFLYVKEAMRMGAMDYLLKIELDPEQLLKCLKKIADQIGQTKKKPLSMTYVDHDQGLKLMQKNILRDTINYLYPNEKYVLDTMQDIEMHLNQTFTYCFMLKVGEWYRFEEVSDHELFVLNFSIMNMVEELLCETFHVYCLEGKTGEFYVFASDRRNYQKPINEQRLNELFENVVDMIREYLNITCIISIGIGDQGVKGIHDAYNQTVKQMHQRVFMSERKVIYLSDLTTSIKVVPFHSLYDKKDKLFKAMNFHKKEELKLFFDEIKEAIKGKPIHRNTVCNVMLELFSLAREYAETYKLDAQDLLKNSMRTYQQLVCMTQVTEAFEWMDLVFKDLITYLDKEDESRYNKLIARFKEFIHKHFDEEISLKQVADEVNLNPSYFSALLKRYIGMNYSEYLTWVRIEEAKKLLIHTDLKVYEVGEKVGYQNTYYFNRIFKKVSGITPGDYKKIAPSI